MKHIPEIRMDRGIPTLYVNGKPFFALGGEVHNSSAESLDYMEKDVWPNLIELHMNTLLVPLYWNRIEPEEGVFDFTLLDGLIRQAEEHAVHLIFLWFGLWKNAESMYVPSWMKRDTMTYFRAEKVNGERLNTISPLCEKAVEKDAYAFSQVMAHIRQIDEEQSVVIMMQVENEIGLLGTPRDYSAAAGNEFEKSIPLDLAEELGVSGKWKEAFGDDAEEAFMAYHLAKAVEKIAAAGRREYPLPCFVNVWLKQFPWYAGSYPSGGAIKEMHQIWKAMAPSVFAIAPDIYVPGVAQVMEEYSYIENPLIIPEVRKDAVTASYALYAFMKYHAVCYSPFGIEELGQTADKTKTPTQEMIETLKLDPLSFDLTGSRESLGAVYRLIEQMKPFYLDYRGSSHMKSYLQKFDADQGSFLRFTDYDIEVIYLPKAKGCPAASGVIFELEENIFLLAGMMSRFVFHTKPGKNVKVDFLKIENGEITDGEWSPYQEMNGDEKMAMIMFEKPVCYRVELFTY